MPASRATARRSASAATDDDDRITNTLLTLNILYQTHIQPHLPEPLQPISNTISSMILSSAPYLSQVIALFRTVVSQAASLSTGTQDGSALLSLGVLLITLYMGIRIMNYVRRTIMSWVWLGVKILLLLVLAQAAVYVNSYGWDRAIRNAGWLGGIGWGLLEDMLNQNQGQGGQRAQPRGTRRRNQNYDNDYNAYGQGRGRGRYG